MTRDDLLTLMRAWGWTLTGSLANGRADLWSHRNGMDEVIIPGAETAPDYDRMLRQAESIIARAEGPRLLAVVRKVAGLADWHETKAEKARRFRVNINGEAPVMDKAAQVHDEAARRIRAALAALTDTTTEETTT